MKTSKIENFLFVTLVLVVAVFIGLFFTTPARGQTVPEENQVEFWCGDDGVKFEPVDTPFIVPAPTGGTTWTLIVLKGGTTNETHVNPVEGDAFSHSEHDNSHVILCFEEGTSTTTVPPTTSTSSSSTSTTTLTTSSTTTTDPSTTTSSSVTTTVAESTTTSSSTSVPDSTVTSTSTDPGTTTIPEVVTDLPDTGSDLTPFALTGVVALLMGVLSLATLRAIRWH